MSISDSRENSPLELAAADKSSYPYNIKLEEFSNRPVDKSSSLGSKKYDMKRFEVKMRSTYIEQNILLS